MERYEAPKVAPAEAISPRLLDKFDRRENIGLGGQVIKVVDIAPERLKTEVPTLVVPGFSATPDTLKDVILRTAQSGRRVVSFEAPHGIATEAKYELAAAEGRKLAALLQVIEKKELQKVNAIADSEAAIYLTAAAVLHPERFENVVLVEPAGLSGDRTLLQLFKSFLQDTIAQMEQDRLHKKIDYPSSPMIGMRSILADVPASLRELDAIAHADIRSALEHIHRAGIGVSIIHAVDDKIFPMAKVQEMIKSRMIDGFYSVRGTHNSIYLYEPFGRAAEAALSALEHKKSLPI